MGKIKDICSFYNFLYHGIIFILILAFFRMNCASITPSVTYDDKFVDFRNEVKPLSTHYDIVYELDGLKEIRIKAECWQTCEQKNYKIVDRYENTNNKLDNSFPLIYQYGGAALLLGLGIGIIIDAPNVPEEDTITKSNPISRKWAYLMGFGSITAGTGLLTLGIMNSIRAKDTVNHIGNVEMEYSVNQKECNKNNWNICDRNIYLQYPDGTAVRNQVSNDGSVIFILPETSKLISYGESPELIIYFKSVTPWKLKLNRSTEFQKAFASYNYTQGQILYNEGKFEGALDKIQLAMKYDDVNKEYIVLRDDIIKKITSPLYTKAKYNFKKGNLEDALKDLESALEYEPNSNEYIQLKSSITYKIAYLQMTPLERALTNVYELPDHVESILDLDVMSYFELEDQYNTDLKKKVFKNSKEYKEKIAELKSLKTQTENQLYFINPPFELSEYNVKKGGFEIELGSNMGQGTAMAIAPKSINDIIFSPFPTTQDSFCVMGECAPYGVYVEHLLLPVTEKNGIKIEEQYENIKVYLIFKLGGIKTIKFEYYCTMYGWYTITQKKLFAKWVRVIIANSQNGEVYFDKSYGSK